MTKQDIIEETAAFYNLGNRGVYDRNGRDTCDYLTSDGKMCAIGRILNNSRHAQDLRESAMSINSYFEDREELDLVLLDAYRGHEVEFWQDVQFLHDIKDNWTVEGLSEEGRDNKNKLLLKWSDK